MKTFGMILLIAAAISLPAVAQDAKAIYEDKCATCHGTDGAGKTAMGRKQKVADVRAAIKTMSADQMAKLVAEG